jgi:hypothetical protein
MDTKATTVPGDAIAAAKRSVLYRIGGYLVSFSVGSISALAGRYLLLGKALQLNPDTFISLVFTIAIGAASMVLALLAINYGRVSEKVITERADRSIEIQMSLFEKSLDLQTRLFDKTMSTLESIGRSTGVTEQRMADIFSFFQNPELMKQIAGRAVEETASEISKKGKEGVVEPQTETQFAERLTKNIVRELSSRIEGLENMVRGSLPTMLQPSLNIPSPGELGRTPEQTAHDLEAARLAEAAKKRTQLITKVVQSIPEVQLLEKDKGNVFWEIVLMYKGKKVGIDMRGKVSAPLNTSYDDSLKFLFRNPVDCLIFVFEEPATEPVKTELESRSKLVQGRIRYTFGNDESTVQNNLLGILESVVADLPSPT